MFSGIIQEVAKIKESKVLNNGKVLSIEISEELYDMVRIGDSIAVNGVCSTITSKINRLITFDYLPETLKKTTLKTLKKNDLVNIEPSLTMNTLINGHIVTGHVDCKGRVKNINKTDEWTILEVDYPPQFQKLVVEKGSIAIEGIALTLVNLQNKTFECHLIPHTYENTIIKNKKINDELNLEFDIIGKYIQRNIEIKN
ncbi:MAG: riboflavin synthase [bacterium]